MKKINPLLAIIAVSVLISFYQISLVSQKLNYYGLNNHLTSLFPWGINWQQNVEDMKISLRAISFKETAQTVSSVAPIENIEAPILDKVDDAPPLQENNQVITTLVDNTKCSEKCTILTVGDSVMGDVYYSLNRQLKNYHPDWKIINAHKVSSGLSHDSYYNWPKVAQKLVEEIKPDYVIILLGMNDAQGITENNKAISFNTESWLNVYKQRAQNMYEVISSKSNVLWIELPNVKSDSFDKRLSVVRKIHQEVSVDSYFTVKNIIGDSHEANFSKFRQNDGIHLNALGADTIAKHIYEDALGKN